MIYGKLQDCKESLNEGNYKIQSLTQEVDKWQFGEEKRKQAEKKLKASNRALSEEVQKLNGMLENQKEQ